MELILHNQLSEIPRAHQALDQVSSQCEFATRSLTHLHVALEEHLANIILHGYDPGQSGTIHLRYKLEDPNLLVEIEDDARAYDLTQAPAVDTSLPLDAKPLGGLGIHMIRKSVDELKYRRVENRNVLTMKKRIR